LKLSSFKYFFHWSRFCFRMTHNFWQYETYRIPGRVRIPCDRGGMDRPEQPVPHVLRGDPLGLSWQRKDLVVMPSADKCVRRTDGHPAISLLHDWQLVF
jgi:hypothetical protein